MSLKFGRVYDIELGGIRIRDEFGNSSALRCTFKVDANDKQTPNTAEVSIYGLNDEHMQELITEPLVPCRISAGYREEGPQLIFSGLLRRAFVRRQGEDTCITASAGDGDEKLATTKFKKSYAKGVTYKAIVQDMVKAFGFESSQLKIEDALDAKSKAALRFNGDATHEMTTLLSRLGCRWFVSNGLLVVQRFDLTTNSSGIKISNLTKAAELVLKKLPGQKEAQTIVTFDTLLEPSLTVGCGFELASPYSQIKGKMMVRSVTHDGDTHGGQWTSHVEATQL